MVHVRRTLLPLGLPSSVSFHGFPTIRLLGGSLLLVINSVFRANVFVIDLIRKAVLFFAAVVVARLLLNLDGIVTLGCDLEVET